mmetsp:Transcript_5925/g.9869  ORF Transcript_5925/g.9869 Transcript_5925/m.9869 type:complete len:468 (-) Transcript_5925:274-1677(-)
MFSACGAESFVEPFTVDVPAAPKKKMSTSPVDPLKNAVEVLSDRLYYIALKNAPPSRTITRHGKPLHFFQIDSELLYWNFFLDFGPLNLGQLYRFSTKLNKLMDAYQNHTIVFYSSVDPSKRANATYLICAWQMLTLERTPEEALRGFRVADIESVNQSQNQNASVPPQSTSSVTATALPPFHDASPCRCTYDLTVLDVLRGLAKARMYGFFDFSDFNVEEYEHFEQVENGDLNWIIRGRILAFAGPHFRRNVSPEGYCTLTPDDYIPYFQEKKVDLVVRLNKRCYEEQDFIKADIRHYEQYYLDGSCPPIKILNRVLEAFETVPSGKAFAVHCKAGLGRTGTCIGAYMMKHYKFTAAEAIGWMRICRPGMVIGPQQHFLQDIEQRMWHEGSVMMLKPTQDVKLLRITESSATNNKTAATKGSPKSVVMGAQSLHFGALGSVEGEAEVIEKGGQAEALLARRNQTRR